MHTIKHSLSYRADIDGLRALAVLPVIFFHAGFELFSGGFVGVDIFFVISGYLITSIIVNDLAAGRFSITEFYVRRARRILPALMVVLLTCLPFAFWLMLPEELKRFGQSLIAVATFSSNVYFWAKTDYFAPAAEEQPLLHTWSLAVEEQYYVFFPLLLMMLWKRGLPRIAAVVTLIAAASFVGASMLETIYPQAAFYLLPTRAWELLAGSIVALSAKSGWVSARACQRYGEVGATAGLAMIVWSIFTFNGHGPASSFSMLLPVSGAALIIQFGAHSAIVRALLANRLCVGIGLISYSAYLWHQPVLAFGKLKFFSATPPGFMLALVVLSILLGYLSWRFVELPTRVGSWAFLKNRALVLRSSGGVLAGTLAIGMTIHLMGGFGSLHRWDGIKSAAQVSSQRSSGEQFCHRQALVSPLGPVTCVIGDARAPVSGVLWGDSFAGALLPGLHRQLARQGHAYLAVLSDGCIPVEGISRTVKKEFGCEPARHTDAVREMLRDPAIKTVVWTGNFGMLTGGMPLDYLIDGAAATPDSVKAKMLGTVQKFNAAGKKLLLIGNPPLFPHSPPEYAMRVYARNGAGLSGQTQQVSRSALEQKFGVLDDILREARLSGRSIDGLAVFCNARQCSSHDARGNLLYADAVHLSLQGADLLARAVVSELERPRRVVAQHAVKASKQR